MIQPSYNKNLDKYKGCLIGCAAGDALGFPVEFFGTKMIQLMHGSNGITQYEVNNIKEKALISDDTQMTLFTANALMCKNGRSTEEKLYNAYLGWLYTQFNRYNPDIKHKYWIMELQDLYEQRAPGSTCLNSLRSGKYGTLQNPLNNSKGCGGIMRVSPIGLYFIGDTRYTLKDIGIMAAKASAITHGHPLGYIPSALFAIMIYLLASGAEKDIKSAVASAIKSLQYDYNNVEYLRKAIKILTHALKLAESDTPDIEAIEQLGEGWVAEETLAIAVYCAVKYQGNFDKALITSVNHNGDSDSTGAVTGSLLGALIGYDAIPIKYKKNLELKDTILEIATDLYRYSGNDYSNDPDWVRKYSR